MSVMLNKEDINKLHAQVVGIQHADYTRINFKKPYHRAYRLENGDVFTINGSIVEFFDNVFYELKETTFFCPITKMYFTNKYRTGKTFTQEELESLAYEKICNNLRDAIDKNSNSES